MDREAKVQVGLKAFLWARPPELPTGDPYYLFILRSQANPGETELNWDIPGGRMNADTDGSPITALQREVDEEIGEEIVQDGPNAPFPIALQEIPRPPEAQRIIRVTLLGQLATPGLVRPRRLSSEHTSFRWATRTEALADLSLDTTTHESLSSDHMTEIDSLIAAESEISLAAIQVIALSRSCH